MPKSQGRDTAVRETTREAALAWFVRMRSGGASETDRADFQRWISAAGEHRRAYEELEALWHDLDGLGDPRRAPPGPAPAARPPARVTRRGLFLGATGATALAAGIAFGLPAVFDGDIHTGVGEQKQVALADGSRLALDADSALSLHFTPQARHVTLLRGRAFFDVAQESARPFSVEAASGVTTATGTQFSVHLWSNEVTVTVLQNAVSVAAGGAAAARLGAGEAVSYDTSGIGEKEEVSDAQATAWQRGKLIFEDRPLRQVIADVNRYRRGRILVTDSRLLSLRVSGIFDISKPDGVLEAITRSLPVGSVALTPYLVLLYPA